VGIVRKELLYILQFKAISSYSLILIFPHLCKNLWKKPVAM
jgi:hypothetical protein